MTILSFENIIFRNLNIIKLLRVIRLYFFLTHIHHSIKHLSAIKFRKDIFNNKVSIDKINVITKMHFYSISYLTK